jgi:DNA protecting protein DprA
MHSEQEEELAAALTLQQLDGVGPVLARRLVEQCGSFETVLKSSQKVLQSIDKVSVDLARRIRTASSKDGAYRELELMSKYGVLGVDINDPRFPYRLKQCNDSPIVIFIKGKPDLNPKRTIAIVGMRQMSEYGDSSCHSIIRDLAAYNPQIISGMAYGVDICAHRYAIKYDLPTIAVLAHGLDRMYPHAHISTAREILETEGAWVSEFPFGVKPDRENFPRRNRLIAGMSDATLVIESGVSGGSMITASLAFGYNREVFAVPGKIGDRRSQGCHSLIKYQKASLVESGADILRVLSWDRLPQLGRQMKIFTDLTAPEKQVVEALRHEDLHIDILALRCGNNAGSSTE